MAALSRRTALGVLALPLALPASAVDADPVFAAIEALRDAEGALTAALRGLNEDDAVQMARADAAADASGDAQNALSRLRPLTMAGLCALIRFHAEDTALLEPDTVGAVAFREVARSLPPAPAEAADPPRSLAHRMGRIAAEGVIAVMVTGSGAALVGLRHLL